MAIKYAHLSIPKFHDGTPLSWYFAYITCASAHTTSDCVVRPGEITLRLEFEITIQIVLLVLGDTCIAKLKHHLAKQNATRIHVRHGDDIFYHFRFELHTWCVTKRIDIPPSSGFPSSVTRFSPSIVVETLFPRNRDLGRSSPIIWTRFAGEM